MILKKSVWQKAIKITGYFEGSGYTTITGNFDGQGISIGFLQWNARQGTLQPLIQIFLNEYSNVAIHVFGDAKQQLQDALNNDFLQFAISINDSKNNIIEPWYSMFYAMCSTPEFQQIQDDAAAWYKNKAISMCEQWNLTTDRAFCLAFDIAVQCGGLAYYDMIETEYIERLKSWAEVAALRANQRWADDVRKRKYAIVYGCDQGRGWPDDVQFDDESAFEEENQTEQEAVIMTVDEAIQVLAEKGIINTPEYWKSACDVVRYLDELLVKIVKKMGG